jgi:hypothetical protein
MRTTIELPDELMRRAKVRAAQSGMSLKVLFIQALESSLNNGPKKTRKDPPVLGGKGNNRIKDLTPEQRDEAMFG